MRAHRGRDAAARGDDSSAVGGSRDFQASFDSRSSRAAPIFTTADEDGTCESAAALYRRASDICADLERDDVPESDVTALRSRALLGLARCDVHRGFGDRAAERYR